jgi:hypothetical protein
MHLFHRPTTEPTTRERDQWAQTIDELVAQVTGPQALFGRKLSRLYDRDVVRACAPALRDIAAVLHDDAQPVSREALTRLETFMCDGARSPLFWPGPDAARIGASELRSAFVQKSAWAGTDETTWG